MTLEYLQGVRATLQQQYTGLLASTPDRPVIKYTNAIELCGAMQLVDQLIAQELIATQAPPGATGPTL